MPLVFFVLFYLLIQVSVGFNQIPFLVFHIFQRAKKNSAAVILYYLQNSIWFLSGNHNVNIYSLIKEMLINTFT